ncbi:MAG: hypothetical protein J5548_06095 [Prevotella sp.]|nr:hypothetical protein [Prevotella sp.]
MKAVHDTLPLLRTWSLDAVRVMRQLSLVYSGRTAYGGKRDKRPVDMKQGRNVYKVVFKLIFSVTQPLRDIIAILNHAFYMEAQGLWNLPLEFLICTGGEHHCPGHILAK